MNEKYSNYSQIIANIELIQHFKEIKISLINVSFEY